jgi:phosphatidylserine/phosphatidylglycerophosphate/cardiolipin synthase-like enzyme
LVTGVQTCALPIYSLIVLPDDTAQPILDALSAAKRSLQIRMFLLTDPALIKAIIAAKRRGVKVRVMLNPARRGGENENDDTKKRLAHEGIEVIDSNPAFELTHQKSMVIDDSTGFVESFNWETKDLTITRDYAVVTTHKIEVEEMVAGFQADWDRKDFRPGQHSQLIWCPNNGRERIANFIDSAKHTLWLQNERYQDTVIIERLVKALGRGVKLHILARPPHTLKKDKLVEGVGGLRIMHDVGAKVHTLKGLKLHAKMILADDARAIVGSINLSPGSFDGRRELAIETDADHVVKRLAKAAQTDWENSHKLDLTDEGLLKDLSKRESTAGGAELLVIKAGGKDKHKPDAKHDGSD